MKKLYLSILWHQHQPFYKDTVNSIYRMPWVYMHSLKDYYDMLVLAVENKVKVTFNLVPILLYQILDYIKNPLQDELLAILYNNGPIHAREEKQLTTYAFSSMDQKKIHASPRYHELLTKKNHGETFTPEDYVDLKVHLLLAWFGQVSFRKEAWLHNLAQKDRGYSNADKEKILQYGESLLKTVIDAHRTAYEQGLIDVSTTPFFHPILPLLSSFQAARVSVPDIPLPGAVSNMANDIGLQIQSGKEYTEGILGKKINGFWPSEGSVSPAVIPEFAKNEVKWVATDQGILAHSFALSHTPFGHNEIYVPYDFSTENGPVRMYFRDTQLSDLIGFTYSQWDTQTAVNDFLTRLARIKDEFTGPEGNPHVNVILDGENAWEHYPNNGYDFLDKLYKAIANAGWIVPITHTEALSLPGRKLEKLFSGSWIYSNFNTWIGHPEKNRAWEFLVKAKTAFEERKDTVDAKTLAEARFALSAAEGSDWFWWYGDDFYSHFSDDFDALFRQHVRNVYQYLGLSVPQELYSSIRGKHRGGLIAHPVDYLTVHPDGLVEGFFDWLGAGEFDLTFDASTMHLATRRLQKLKFGPSQKHTHGFYMAIEGNLENPYQETLEIEILNNESIIIEWDMQNKTILPTDGQQKHLHIQIAQKDVIEMYVPFSQAEEHILVQFRVKKNGQIIEKAPMYSMAKLPLKVEKAADWII